MTRINSALNFLYNRFGITREVFEEYALLEDKDIWITSKESANFDMKFWRRKGIRLVRVFKSSSFKFTTAGMQMFGKYAKKNVVTLNEENLEKYLRGENIKIDTPSNVTEGQVIVRYENDVLGSAIYRNGILKNQLPKGRRML